MLNVNFRLANHVVWLNRGWERVAWSHSWCLENKNVCWATADKQRELSSYNGPLIRWNSAFLHPESLQGRGSSPAASSLTGCHLCHSDRQASFCPISMFLGRNTTWSLPWDLSICKVIKKWPAHGAIVPDLQWSNTTQQRLDAPFAPVFDLPT